MLASSVSTDVSCVTGATGFLASELVHQLLLRGHTVKATVRTLAKPERVAYLRRMKNAAQLQLLEADLLVDGAFDACVQGADYVFHTASPFVTEGITDPEMQLIAPALNGTRNVFESIRRAIVAGGAKPAVAVTSSIAAVMGKMTDKPDAECFDEDDWNFSSRSDSGGLDSYRYSKLVAEKEAWKLAEELGLRLSTVNPSFIIGPPHTPRVDGESLRNMKMALEGKLPHRGDTPMIDVRDCAAVHVAAVTRPEGAGKRFITSTGQAVPRARLLELLRQAYPQWQIADPGGQGGLNEFSGWQEEGRTIFCSKTLAPLGITLRDAEASLLDMAHAMMDLGVVQPNAKKPTEQEQKKSEL